MKRPVVIGVAIAALLAVTAIASVTSRTRSETRTMDLSSVSSDLATLSKLIKLPVTPQSVRWQVIDPSKGKSGLGPSDWAVVAVMHLTAGQADQLISSSAVRDSSNALLDARYQGLLSAELKGRAGDILASRPAPQWRTADPFLRQPLLNGFFVLSQDASKLVLVLTTA